MQDTDARHLCGLEAGSGEVRHHLIGLRRVVMAAAPALKDALEVARRETITKTDKYVCLLEDLVEGGMVTALRHDFLDRVGLQRRTVAPFHMRRGNRLLQVREEAVVDAAHNLAHQREAPLVKTLVAQHDFALGNTLVEGGDVGGEHLCFLAKGLTF